MYNKEEQIKVYVMVGTIIMLLVIFSGITYAFFSASNNKGSTSLISATSGKMTINYVDGSSKLLSSKDVQPSNKIIIDKTFTLTGTNTTSGLAMPYKVGIKYTSGFSYGQLHYYLKRTSANSNITSNLIGTSNQTIPGNTTETGYTSGTFIKNNTESYLELAIGEFKANTSNQTITFNLKIQFPDTGKNQDSEKGATFNGEIVVNYEDKLNNIAIGYDYLEPTEVNSEPYYTFTAPKTGTYKIETWGAQGTINGGLGAYSHGQVILQKDQKIYVYIGGQNGYNGGTNSDRVGGSGGGATHIATKTGQLFNLSSSLTNILIISGGGGGGDSWKTGAFGGNAGGIIGGASSITTDSTYNYATGGSQTNGGVAYTSTNYPASNGAFGQGGVSTSKYGGHGGGGYYGGGAGGAASGWCAGGGGGSSYIENTLLTNKAMYCYNCTESSETSTKTISTTCHSENPTSNCAKEGNGYAKITLISN